MPRPKPTEDDLQEREKRADKIKKFLKNFKFTEVQFADALGISRRSAQMMKAGKVTPAPETIDRLERLFKKYKKSKVA